MMWSTPCSCNTQCSCYASYAFYLYTAKMGLLLFQSALSMAAVTCTLYTAITTGEGECNSVVIMQTSRNAPWCHSLELWILRSYIWHYNVQFCMSLPLTTVTLTADALPIPGGYVVPEGSNVTFTCNSSSGRYLFWRLNVTNDMRIRTDTASLKWFSGFSSRDKSEDANPASFTFHDISLENNPSPVECIDTSIQDDSKASTILAIIVEGELSTLLITIPKAMATWM